jgi:hypothetical protein
MREQRVDHARVNGGVGHMIKINFFDWLSIHSVLILQRSRWRVKTFWLF